MTTQNTITNNRLKELRLARGFTQQQVAEKLGLNAIDRISKWEAGSKMPSLVNALRLAEIYRVKIEDIFD